MKVLTCGSTRRRLHAFHDEELPIGDQIAVGAHLDWCDECASELAQIRLISGALRSGSSHRMTLSTLTPEEETSLQAGVISRVKAEQTVSFVAQAREMFQDMHFVYAGLGGATAAVVCVLIMLGMMRLVNSDRPDTLAGIADVLRSPGATPNPAPPLPRIQMPRPLSMASFYGDPDSADDSLIMMAAIVTREGTVTELALLDPGGGRQRVRAGRPKAVEELLGAVSRARFEPATVDGLPVAVNIVFVVEHTTVRGTGAVLKKRAAFRTPLATTA